MNATNKQTLKQTISDTVTQGVQEAQKLVGDTDRTIVVVVVPVIVSGTMIFNREVDLEREVTS